MQVHQPIPQLLQNPQRHRRPVEKLPPRARRADLPLDHQHAFRIGLHTLLLQPAPVSVGSAQFPFHHTPLRPRPHQTFVRPFPQEQQERINQNGLAGPRLPRQDIEAFSELPLHPLHHRQILDPQPSQHEPKVEGR